MQRVSNITVYKVCLQLLLFDDRRLVCKREYVKDLVRIHKGKCLFKSRTAL